ncbi:MAG: branched-chain amino acid ABC transporter permease [Pseudomonadota bacterium]
MTGKMNDIVSSGLAGSLALAAAFLMPLFFNDWELLQLMIYVILSMLALSLAFIWGFGGILSFGHAVFFGLGAYAYAIAAANFGETTLPLLLSIAVPSVFAVLFGYFMLYGRISDVYLGAITLSLTLVFEKFMNSTAGPQYVIGEARLGGANGIPSIPRLNVPGFPDWVLSTSDLFGLCVILLAGVYIGLKFLISSDFGRIIIAVRENEMRAELLGYDARKYKLITFVIGAAIAGLAGCLFANWGGFISPKVFALSQSIQIIIWVVFGGVGTLVGPILGCMLIQWFTTYLTTVNIINKDVVLGALLTAVVLLLPSGLIPTIQRLINKIRLPRNTTARIAVEKAESRP